MTIFNRMGDKQDEPAKAEDQAAPAGGMFRIMFGTEDCQLAITPGLTIKEAFKNKSEVLGLDFDRRLSYRDNEGNILTGEEAPVANRDYLCAVTHDSKGR